MGPAGVWLCGGWAWAGGGWVACVCVSGCEGALLEVKAAVESGPVDPEEDGADEREEVRCHRGLVRGRLRLRLTVRLRVGGLGAWARAGDNDENFCSVRLEPGFRHRSHGRRPRVVGRLAEHIGARQPEVGTEEVDDDRAYA